ncbi:DUF6879 family protein [Streptomyces sp. NPDC001787]|uniref:DUF6879 family protein n=1 Tax=Streptomyces sp. NPDC001787 TaxID=3154523 RepID=UPI00332DD23F
MDSQGWTSGPLRWAGLSTLVPADLERTVARGVKVRRARIVSEPVTDYIRFGHAITDANLRAGQQVRGLPAAAPPPSPCPATTSGSSTTRSCGSTSSPVTARRLEPDHTEDPQAIKLCTEAFRSVWDLATPHADYRI